MKTPEQIAADVLDGLDYGSDDAERNARRAVEGFRSGWLDEGALLSLITGAIEADRAQHAAKETTMQIMIDNQKVLDLPVQSTETDEGLELWLALNEAHQVLEAWKHLDVAHRDYRYGGSNDDPSPCEVHLAAVGATGALHMETVDPFWDGSDTRNGWPLDELSSMIELDWEGAS